MTQPADVFVLEDAVTVVPATEEGVTLYVLTSEVVAEVQADLSEPDVVEIVVPGPKGDKGDKGDAGQPGAVGGTYTHVQNTPQINWFIFHDLGYQPGGFLFEDEDGKQVEPIVSNVNLQVALATFVRPTTGKAYIS